MPLGVSEDDRQAHPHVLQVHVEVARAAGGDEGEQVGVPPVQGGGGGEGRREDLRLSYGVKGEV